MSNRQKKKLIKEGVERLKKMPGWDPARRVRQSPEAQLRALDQESRNESLYGEAPACSDCVAARAATGDETALCDAHLREAMGF